MASTVEISIGKLSGQTGVKVPTIRYYESVDLLPAPARTASNRRLYGDADVRRLSFIRHARELGFEVDAIRDLLTLADDPSRSCADVDAIAVAHLDDIDSKIARLKLLRGEVHRMLDECARGRIGECRVIESLGSHAQCRNDHRSAKQPRQRETRRCRSIATTKKAAAIQGGRHK